MPGVVSAMDFLAQPHKHPPQSVCVVYGGEEFLVRQCLRELRGQILPQEEADLSLKTFDGAAAELRDVMDELKTRALFGGGQRLVVVEGADPFVTRNRTRLEEYVARPSRSAVLVLEVGTWPANTRLAKLVAESGLSIECKAPPPRSVPRWLAQWAKTRHDLRLGTAEAELLVELVGPELGLLDQELAKLAAACGGEIQAEAIARLVGDWRTRSAWDLVDAAAAGDAPAALAQLDRLLSAGQQPVAVLAQLGTSLRRFAAATQRIERAEAAGKHPPLRQVLEQVGFKSFVVQKAEQQLRQIGRQRARQLDRWLLEADRDLKGGSQLPPRIVLERLIARLAQRLRPAAGGPRH